jgi:hypothetical protein
MAMELPTLSSEGDAISASTVEAIPLMVVRPMSSSADRDSAKRASI